MTDCVIIGGGVIGLSIARELAGRGMSVHVLARERGRTTASWAAAGIFPPAPPPVDGVTSAGDRLTSWSDALHRRWAEELREETGIDTELRACGGLHLAASDAGLERLAAAADAWRARGAGCDWLTTAEITDHEPALAPAVSTGGVRGGVLLPDETSLRPPRHLEALAASCRHRGVTISGADVRSVEVHAGVVTGVVTTSGVVRGAATCFATGAWSGDIAASVGLAIETRPIRGQIALLRLPRQVLGRVVNFGIDYLVPRDDGRLLVGSTIEDAGFAATTTPEAVDRLLGVASRLLGDRDATVEQAWAGLRPGSIDGLPTIGRIPGLDNAFIAAGHFRAGLHQSTGTAVVMADLVTGAPPSIDPAPFSPGRRSANTAAPGPDSVAAYLARAADENP
ncbi:MAG: FAD-dependent oxidoreductase [Planctomycetia bacterium]